MKADPRADHLRFLLSPSFSGGLALSHRADLEKSGITEASRIAQGIRSVPPSAFTPLLGFRLPTAVGSLMLIPYIDPSGGFFSHIRVKCFPTVRKVRRAGRIVYVSADTSPEPSDRVLETLKYLQPKGSAPRLYFAQSVLPQVMDPTVPLYLVEGEKKTLAAAQLELAAVGVAGIHAWHRRGSRDLLEDFARIRLAGRAVVLVPDGDVQTNPHVEEGAVDFATALEAARARVRIAMLPVAA